MRKTSANEFAEADLIASIKAHGLLENLVARADDPGHDGAKRFAVVAGGRRLAALKALAEDGTLDADHPAPCKIAANGNAGELSLAETGGIAIGAAKHSNSRPFRLAGPAARLRGGRSRGPQRPGDAGQLRLDAGERGAHPAFGGRSSNAASPSAVAFPGSAGCGCFRPRAAPLAVSTGCST